MLATIPGRISTRQPSSLARRTGAIGCQAAARISTSEAGHRKSSAAAFGIRVVGDLEEVDGVRSREHQRGGREQQNGASGTASEQAGDADDQGQDQKIAKGYARLVAIAAISPPVVCDDTRDQKVGPDRSHHEAGCEPVEPLARVEVPEVTADQDHKAGVHQRVEQQVEPVGDRGEGRRVGTPVREEPEQLAGGP